MAFAFISTMIWRGCYFFFLSKYASDIIHPKFSRKIFLIYQFSPFRAEELRTSSIPMFFSEKWNKPHFDAKTFPNGKQKPSPVGTFWFLQTLWIFPEEIYCVQIFWPFYFDFTFPKEIFVFFWFLLLCTL